MTRDEFDSLQNIGCIPFSVYPDVEGGVLLSEWTQQDAVNYFCPEFGINFLDEQHLEVIGPGDPETPTSTLEDVFSGGPVAPGNSISVDVYAPDYPTDESVGSDSGGATLSINDIPSVPAALVELTGADNYSIERDVYAPEPAAPKETEETNMTVNDLFANTAIAAGQLSTFERILNAASNATTIFNTLNGPDDVVRTTGDSRTPGGAEPLYQGGQIVLNAYACKPGKHISKKTGACVTNRHMNFLNPRALSRSVRRLAGFQNFATRTEKAIQKSFRKAGVHPTRRTGGKCGTCRKTNCSCR